MIKTWILVMFVVLMAIPFGAEAFPTVGRIYCEDANTLAENITVYADDNVSTLSLPIHCAWGCDNVTLSCSPNPFMQDIYFVAFFIAAIVVIVWILKVRI